MRNAFTLLPRRRQILKYFVLIFAVYIAVRLFSRSDKPDEEPGLPILVAQRGNDHYFRAKPRLNSESYSKQTLQWGKKKHASLSTSEVTYGKLNVHIWEEICGNDLNSLINHVLFPKFPSRRFYAQTTRFSHGIGNYNYGERIFGYLLPQSTGLHSFEILGESVEVWISTNSNSSFAKQLYKNVAEQKVGRFQLQLTAITRYYVEILHKKSSQAEDFLLTWKIPGSSSFVELSGLDISVPLLDGYLHNGEVDGSEASLEIPIIHRKLQFPKLSKQEQERNDLFKFPLIQSEVTNGVLTSCDYKPSYVVDHNLTNYKGVWETHYNSLYPADKTNVTRDGWVCLGNDVLEENEAVQIVDSYMLSLNNKNYG